MFKAIINGLSIGGFVPFLTSFYMLNGQPVEQVLLSVVYGLILALAIKIN